MSMLLDDNPAVRLAGVLAVLALVSVLSVSFGGSALAIDPTRFMIADEVEPGMTGYGLTTFSDTTVSRFEVTVLGVMRGWIPGGDLIIIEATGGPLAETGIYKGMSGSPVYFGERLAGAVAFNLGSFGERAIGGVTPIAEMLPMLDDAAWEAGDGDGSSPGGDAPTRSGTGRRSDLGWGPGSATDVVPQTAAGSGETGPGRSTWDPADIQPIRTPLVMAGFHPETRRAMADFFDQLGCSIVAGGAGGAAGMSSGRTTGGESTSGEAGARTVGATLQPGAPVGVQMVRGDAEATGLGTITYVDDDLLLAFGHPMFQAGIVNMPLTAARVFAVYPSQAISFVIGAAAETRGRVISDRQTGIMGRIGETSPMLPVSIDIVDAQGRLHAFSYELIQNKFFVTQFLGFLAHNSLMAVESSFGDVTLEMHMKLRFDDGTLLEFDDLLSSFTGPQQLAQQVSQPLAGILLSGIEEVGVAQVDIDLQVSPEVRMAVIEEITIDRARLRPGETVAATVYLRRFEQERLPVRLEIEVPDDLLPGPTLLRVCSVGEALQWERERAPRRFMPQSLEQYVALFEEQAARNTMRLTLHAAGFGVAIGGREMMALPSSVFRVMDTDRRTGGRSGTWGRLVHEQSVETAYQLAGCQELRLEVTGPDVTVAPRPGASPAEN